MASRKSSYSARIEIIGINPFVHVPAPVLAAIFADAGKSRGPIPVRGTIEGEPFVQTLVRYQGAWRLYLNGPMRVAAGVDVGDLAHLEVVFDPASRVVPTDPALARALSGDRAAKRAFEALSPSRKKEISRYLGALKSEVTRARNIERVLAHLAERPGEKVPAFLRPREHATNPTRRRAKDPNG
jgi:hypothetical protein